MAESKEKNDVVEIPVGRFLKAIRSNPWMIATIVLGIIVVILAGLLLAADESESVDENAAAERLVKFINAQGRGEATLVSAEQEGGLYKVTVKYQGQDVPVFVTLDGKYLVSDPIPLNADAFQEQEAPREPVSIEIGESPVKGTASASVTIIEFSDYQCPFCQRFYADAFKQIDENYIKTGKVKFAYKDFPLSNIHPDAQKAAEAARCVRDQKGDPGYFRMHDLLFENQEQLSEENYKKWARSLGVAAKPFDDCLASGKHAAEVQSDLKYGSQLGVAGTPAFFVNGRMLEGAQPYSAFEQVIEEALTAGTQ